MAMVFDPGTVGDAGKRLDRIEPLSWWTGMKTPLQLLVRGDGISLYDIRIEGGKGVLVKAVHKADSPNYCFVDVAVAEDAAPGTYWLVFDKDSESFKYPYEIAARSEGSASRKSFTTADMIYLIMPDRFANGDPSNDTTPDTAVCVWTSPADGPAMKSTFSLRKDVRPPAQALTENLSRQDSWPDCMISPAGSSSGGRARRSSMTARPCISSRGTTLTATSVMTIPMPCLSSSIIPAARSMFRGRIIPR